MKILVTASPLQRDQNHPAMDLLRRSGYELIWNPTRKPLAGGELIAALRGCQGCLAGVDFFSRDVLAACPDLRVISRYGVGYDRVDLDAAREFHIAVSNTPGVNAEAVGELTMGLLLSVARRIPQLDRSTRDGQWTQYTGMELCGKTVAILGLGAIGRVVARCCAGFGMRVTAWSPHIDRDYCRNYNIAVRPWPAILEEADVVTLHMPLTAKTHHLIDAAAIARMKPGAILLNAARGGIVDEDAAYAALVDGRLGGFGLDAFASEPPGNSPLFDLPNVVVTPHVGSHTKEGTDQMAFQAAGNLLALLEGRPCPDQLC